MSEHTPLPWTADGNCIEDAEFTIIAKTFDTNRVSAKEYAALIVRSVNLLPELVEALSDLHAFVAVIFGRGEDASIPETITTPLGVPVKIGAIMRDAEAALSKAKATS